jgi:hypothetical protein
MGPRPLPWLAAIVLFSAIAFAISGESWITYGVGLAIFLAIFAVITLRTRR